MKKLLLISCLSFTGCSQILSNAMMGGMGGLQAQQAHLDEVAREDRANVQRQRDRIHQLNMQRIDLWKQPAQITIINND